MKIFYYDKMLLTGLKAENVVDMVLMSLDLIFGIWVLNELSEEGYQRHFMFTLILFGIVIYFVCLSVKLAHRYLIVSNIEKEKLEITQTGLNMTFHEKVLSSESLKYAEVPWAKVKSAEAINQDTSRRGFKLSDLLPLRELSDVFVDKKEYKTIRIYTSDGLFSIFIEKNNEAVKLINSYINPAKENNQTENANNYQQKQEEKKEKQTANKWVCECGALVYGFYCPMCGKKQKIQPAAKIENVKTVGEEPQQKSHVCKCGERFYGNFCPNCGRDVESIK